MEPTEHYLAALHAMKEAKRWSSEHPAHMRLTSMAQTYAALATAGAALLAAGYALPQLPDGDDDIVTWRRTA